MNPLLLQFIEETRDILENMGKSLLALEKRPDDTGVIDGLFRSVHTLKGNSGLFDLGTLTRVVHAAEDVLDKVRDHLLTIDAGLTDELLSCMDFIQRLMEEVEATGSIPDHFTDEANELIAQLRGRLPAPGDHEDFRQDEDVEQVMPPADLSWLTSISEERLAELFSGSAALFGVRYVPEPQCFFKGEDPINSLRSTPGLEAVLVRPLNPWPPTDQLDVYECNLHIDALSVATREELLDHFRYTPDQVAIYEVPRRQLAVPTGEWGEGAAVVGPLLEQLQETIAAGDPAGMAAAIELGIDMLGPELACTSLLRWAHRFVAAGMDISDIAPLVRAIEQQALPHWDVTSDMAESDHDPAPAPTEQESAANPRVLDSLTAEMLASTLAAQKTLLDTQTPASVRSGHLAAIALAATNALSAIGDNESSAAVSACFKEVVATEDLLPLVVLLDDLMTRYELPEEPAPEPETVLQSNKPPEATVSEVHPEGPRSGSESTDRPGRVLKVPQEKVDRLMDLIGEMVVAKNALPYLAARAEEAYGSRELAREIKLQFAVINRIAEDMQDGIMQVRMLPMGSIFQRFPRLVRDVAKQLGKKVRLVLEGEDAEADKHIVESLGDPLIHILRNSLDHGIEEPAVRSQKGKDEEGRIVVRASQEGDRVIIEIEDDGKGMDPLVIKRKAFEKGLIDEARLETISDHEAVQLVFAPGFSTAETISNLSGRGVGMDVVKTSLEKFGGQVRLVSEKNKGTKISLTLPLSVAVSNVLMIHVGGQRYGIPMDVVRETVRLPADQIHLIKDRRIAVLRGNIVPLFGADQLLALPEPPKSNADGELAVLVVRINGSTVGLIVDGFAQTTDVILKPLEGPLQGLSGFAGSALLGDGSVLLVLDLKELL